MKINERGSNNFNPFDLVITIESEAEAKAMYAIFNHVRNVDILPNGDEIVNVIKDKIGREFYDANLCYKTVDFKHGKPFYGNL